MGQIMTTEVTTLSNGFRIATDHMPSLRTAAVAVRVDVGARNEPAKYNGIAHFLEHMAFKGTRQRSAIEIAETIEDVGGFLNAYTSRDTTVYAAGVLEENVSLAVELIADILRNSVFDPEEIELERGVILSEIGEYEDSPIEVVFDALQRTAYPKQQFGRPIIGTKKTVSSFQRSDFQSFVAKHYGPERMILIGAGAVSHDEMVKLAENLFGDGSKLPKVRTRRPEFKSGEWCQKKDIEMVQFALAFPGPNQFDQFAPAATTYGVVLGGGASSRLFREAREKRGLCYSISSQSSPKPDSGQFMLHASTNGSLLEELIEVSIDEIRKSANDLTVKEINRAKTQIRVAILMAFESPSNRIERMGKLLSSRGYVESLDESIARYDAVTPEAVMKYAQNLATSSEFAMAAYGPIPPSLDSDTIRRHLAA